MSSTFEPSRGPLRSRTIGAAIAILLGLGAIGVFALNLAAEDRDSRLARGRWLAEQNCGVCHDVSRTAAPDSRNGVPSFVLLARRASPDRRVGALHGGHPVMPPPVMTEAETTLVGDYITSLAR